MTKPIKLKTMEKLIKHLRVIILILIIGIFIITVPRNVNDFNHNSDGYRIRNYLFFSVCSAKMVAGNWKVYDIGVLGTKIKIRKAFDE